MSKKKEKVNKISIDEKAWLYTFLLVLIGWILAKIPIVNFILAVFVLLCAVIILFAMIRTTLEEKEEKNKKGKK